MKLSGGEKLARVIFLGTAGSTFSGRNMPPSLLVDGGVLLDCPAACPYVLATMGRLDEVRIILLSHLHPDHSLGVVELLWHLWIRGSGKRVEVVGPRGTRRFFERILEVLHPEKFETILSHGVFREIGPGDTVGNAKAFEALHTVEALAYRLTVSDRSLCYSGDTSPSEKLVEGFAGCDLLVHEATYPPGMEDAALRDGHSTPVHAATIALRAGARRLALVHLPYARLGDVDEEYLRAARAIFKNTFIPKPFEEVAL